MITGWYTRREYHSLHSVRSIAILRDCGLKMTERECLVIRWHMKGEHYHTCDSREEADHAKAVRAPLWIIVLWRDKDDARMHPAGGRKAKASK